MKVSVLISTFNSSKTLPLTLESLRNQTIQDFEILICDSSSTDGTIEITERYGAKIVGYNIRNIALARDILLEKASRDIFIFIDSDVIVSPYFTEAHIRAHMNNPEIDVLSSNVTTVSKPPSSYRIVMIAKNIVLIQQGKV